MFRQYNSMDSRLNKREGIDTASTGVAVPLSSRKTEEEREDMEYGV